MSIQALKAQLKNSRTLAKDGVRDLTIVFMFIILNAVKISLFNFYIIPIQTVPTFQYKFVYTLLFSLIVFPLLLKIKPRVIIIALYLGQTLYIFINLSYYLFFHSYLHILQSMALFNEAFITTGHFATPKSSKLLILFLDLPFFIFVLFRYAKIRALNLDLQFARRMVLAFSIIVIILIESQNIITGFSIFHFAGDRYRGESPIVQRYGTLANGITSIWSIKSNKDLVSQLEYGKEIFNPTNSKTKPNFVVIQVESLESNAINYKHKNEYITPYLRSLADNSIYYPFMLSYHKGGGTSDCEFSVINSVEPFKEFPALKLANYDYHNSMVSRVKNADYATMAFHGNVGDFYNRDVAFPKMGFQNFYDMNRMKMKNVGWGAPDADVFNFTLQTLSKAKQPFLSYIITMTSHGPYTNARNYYSNPRYDDITNTTVRDYCNSMSYVDQSIKDYVTSIQNKFDNTYIFIFGDHCPNIGVDIYKQVSMTIEDTYFEFIPLFIITPDKKVLKNDKEVVSFLDIAPTLLNASGIQYGVKSDGEDLIKGNGFKNKIPYNGYEFERRDLMKKVRELCYLY